MKSKKYALVVLSILILLVFVSSASAADTNKTTDVLSADESTSTVNEKLALDYTQDTSGEFNDSNVIENDKEILQVANSDDNVLGASVNTLSVNTSVIYLGDTIEINYTSDMFDDNSNEVKIELGDIYKEYNAVKKDGTVFFTYNGTEMGQLTGKFTISGLAGMAMREFNVTVKEGPKPKTFYVNASVAGGDGSKAKPFQTLIESLAVAEDGDIIMIASGEYKGVGSNTNLTIDKNLNFIKYGEGEAIFNAEGIYRNRIWTVDATSINITGLSFINGNYFLPDYSYDIYAEGAALYFVNYCSNSNINATFINNTVELFGGAISFYHGGFSGNLTGTFINNSAMTLGGAICVRNGSNLSGNITATFINNVANFGGAIDIIDSNLSNNFNGIFINNTAWSNGGAISTDGSNVVVRDCIFINNNDPFYSDNGGVITAIDCWFGNNATNYNETPVSEHFLDNNWLFLNATANPAELNLGDNSTVTFELYSYNKTSEPSLYDASKMNILLDLTQTLGELDKTNASFGEGIKYTAKEGGNGSVTGKFETASYTIDLKNTKKDLNLSGFVFGVGDTIYIFVMGFENATGNVTISVNANNYTTSIRNSMAIVSIPKVSQNTTAYIYYPGDNKYNNASTSVHIHVREGLNITATADPITVGENAKITVTGLENATGNVTVTIDNYTYYGSILNSTATVIIPGLKNNITITVKYDGDDTYYGTFTTIDIIVYRNNLNITATADQITVGDNATVKVTGLEDATGEIKVVIDGKEWIGEISKGTAEVIITGLKETVTAEVLYPGDEKYNNASTTVDISVKKDLNLSGFVFGVGDTIYIFVMDFENATGNVTITVNANNYTTSIRNSTAIVSMPKVSENTTAYIYYPGDNKYNNASTSVHIHVREGLNITATADPITVGENATVKIMGLENATGNVTVTINNNTYYSPIKKGTATVIIPGLKNNVTATVNYAGDDNYYATFTTIDIIVYRNNLKITATADPITVGDNATVKVTDLEDATGEIKVVIDGNEWIGEISKGTAEVIIPGLKETVTAEVLYPGDEKYNNASTTVDIVVNPAPAPEKKNLTISASADPITVGENATVKVTGLENATGNVSVIVKGKIYAAPIKNGEATLTVPGLTKNVIAIVNYKGDDIYNPALTIINITVYPNIINIDAPDVTKNYGGPERFVVNVTDSKGAPLSNKTVYITINSKTYNRTTDENGIASLGLNLHSGIYNVISTVDNQTVISLVTILPTVNGTDIVKMYKNGTQYYATFRDSKGKYLADGTTVKFNINGVFYERKVSGDKGLAKLNINLPPGEYVITALNPATGENAANKVTVLPTLVENKDITKYYKNATQYTVKVLGANGNPVGAGKTVTFNINGVMYQRQTNESGIAKLNINLPPGDYTITASYEGCNVANTITVLPILSASDLQMKYMDGSQFKATLLDGQGNPYPNKNVTFNINGVFYNRATGDDGVAKLNINLPAGEYIITSSYNGCNIANKVTIRG